MKTTHTVATLAATLITLGSLAGRANATLIIDIEGTPGSSILTWTLSGSDTASGTSHFDFDSVYDGLGTWNDFGDFVSVHTAARDTSLLSNSATVTVGGVTRNVDTAYLDDDSGIDADDVGIGVDGASDLSIINGDLVTWTGSFTTDLYSFDNLIAGSYTNTSDADMGGLELTLNISQSSVPEPSSALLLGFGALGMIARRKRTT